MMPLVVDSAQCVHLLSYDISFLDGQLLLPSSEATRERIRLITIIDQKRICVAVTHGEAELHSRLDVVPKTCAQHASDAPRSHYVPEMHFSSAVWRLRRANFPSVPAKLHPTGSLWLAAIYSVPSKV